MPSYFPPIQAIASVAHRWVNAISGAGVATATQPAAGDVSGLASSATIDTTNATNITSGTLPNGRLSSVPNSALANSSITIGGHSVSLGGSQTLAASDLTNGTTGSGSVVLSAAPSLTGEVAVGHVKATGNVVLPSGSQQGYWGADSIAGATMIGQGSTADLTLFNKSGGAALQVLTGTTNVSFPGSILLKGPNPWADVKAYGAIGNGTADDSTAIQAAINAVQAQAGGVVYFPPGTYYIATGLTVAATSGKVILQGAGWQSTLINTKTNNITAISFAANFAAAMRDIFVLGCNNNSDGVPSCTNPAVSIGNNAPVDMRDCRISGGTFALFTQGVDGSYDNCYIGAGYNGAINSQGSNWYVRCKIDTAGLITMAATYYGWKHDGPPGGANALTENHMTLCDFSGPYTYCFLVDDTHNQAVVVCDNGVFGSPVLISGCNYVGLYGMEATGSITNSGGGCVAVTNCMAFSAITASNTGAGSVIKANNFNIT